LTAQLEAEARQRGDHENLVTARLGAIGALVELGRWGVLARAAEARSPGESDSRWPGGGWHWSIVRGAGSTPRRRSTAGHGETRSRPIWPPARLRGGAGALGPRTSRPRRCPAERGLAHRCGCRHRRLHQAMRRLCNRALDLDDLTKAAGSLASVEGLQPRADLPRGHRARLRAQPDARRGVHDRVDMTTDRRGRPRRPGFVRPQHPSSSTPNGSSSGGGGRMPSRCSPRRAGSSSGSRRGPGSSASTPCGPARPGRSPLRSRHGPGTYAGGPAP
jgi:hypothetical protein